MAVDAETEASTLLSANWLSANTDSRTPAFQVIGDRTHTSLLIATAQQDLITVYETTSPVELSGGAAVDGSGNRLYRHTSNIKYDIRTVVSKAHALKLRDEVLRILHANHQAPTGSFDKIKPPFLVTNLTDKSKGIYRYVIDAKFITHRRTYT